MKTIIMQNPPGIIHISETDAKCPTCGNVHPEKWYFNQLRKSKNSLIYKECKKCGAILGITHDMRGDIVVWLKDEEANSGEIILSTPTKLVLDFIIAGQRDLEQYFDFVPELQKKFIIREKTDLTTDATFKLIQAVIDWETSSESKSLEPIIMESFLIGIII